MRREFITLDVFTRRRFTGNPLAVVLDADGLDDATMHAVAREFNLPETAFVMRPVDASNDARLRIFTTTGEMPFAGHPTIGAAVVLGHIRTGSLRPDLTVELAAGPVRCAVSGIEANSGHAAIRVPRLPQRAGKPAAASAIAAALCLDAGEIGFDAFAPACWSAGLAFTFVPLRSRDALARCLVNPAAWDVAFSHEGSVAAYVFCAAEPSDEESFSARMFAPGLGIPEDPATGSAVAAFAGVLGDVGLLSAGASTFSIRQGEDMGRPSVIALSVYLDDRGLNSVSIAGDAIAVSKGTIETSS